MSRTEWAGKLAVLVAPDRVAEATATLEQITRMLDDFPDRCFASRTALTTVAAMKRRTIIPTLTDIRAGLLDWMKANPQDAGTGRPSGWDFSDNAWYDYWLQRAGNGFPPPDGRIDVKDGRAHLLSLLRKQAPKVANYIEPEPVFGPLTALQRAHAEAIIERWRNRRVAT